MREVFEISIFCLALDDVLLDLLGIKVHHFHCHVSHHLVFCTVSTFLTKSIILEHLMLPNNLDAKCGFFVISDSSVVKNSELSYRPEEQE